MKNKNLLCPLCPSRFAREQNRLIHVVMKHTTGVADAKAIISNTLNKVEEVINETGTEGRERLNRDNRATTGADQGGTRLRERLGR